MLYECTETNHHWCEFQMYFYIFELNLSGSLSVHNIYNLRLFFFFPTFYKHSGKALSSQHSKPVIVNIPFLFFCVLSSVLFTKQSWCCMLWAADSLWPLEDWLSLCCRQQAGRQNLATCRPCAPVRLWLDHYLAGPEKSPAGEEGGEQSVFGPQVLESCPRCGVPALEVERCLCPLNGTAFRCLTKRAQTKLLSHTHFPV